MWLHGSFLRKLIVITRGTLPVVIFPEITLAEENKAQDFDRETLKALGIDPEISQYFAEESRFAPGEIPLALKVNGSSKGSVIARFSEKGELCFDEALLKQADLKIPGNIGDTPCYDYRKSWPKTIVQQHPDKEELNIIVPTDALDSQADDLGDYVTGGTAGVLNYSLFSTRNQFADSHSDYSQATIDGGFNILDWMVRSHQMLSYNDGNYSTTSSSTWIQHTFVELGTTMKAGEVSLNNTLLDGASIYGVSFSPDSALSPDDAGVQVSGIANTSQARVEIRQGNKLIASNLVPQGPFTLTDLKLLDRSSDLSVTVVESDGSQQRFIVPATQYNRGVGTPTGIHVAFGRVDDDYKKTPWVGSVSMGKRLTNNINLSGGLIGGQDYQNAAINVDWLLSRLSATTQIAASNDREYNLQGQKASVSANYALTQNVSLRASASHATRDYRTLSDSLDSDFVAQNKNEYSAGVSLATGMTGSLGLSYYQADSYQNSNDSRYLALSWSKVFRRATLSVSWQHQLGTNGRMRYADGNGKDSNTANDKDLVYVNLSVPLGSNSANLYSRHDSNSTHFGAAMNANVSDELNYSVGAERGTKDNVNAVNGGINANLHYTQLSMNASADSDHNRTYSASLQGGIVAHGDGMTFSPWPINDTFAVAQLDSNISGVKIDTPQGPVWTDRWGQAIVPTLPPYRNALVQIDTETLPRNVDVSNGSKRIKQGRGSVGNVNFKVLEQRRAMLYVTLPDGSKLPRGIAVEDNQGKYLTTVVDDGIVFINNILPRQVLVARLENGVCRIETSLPENSDPNTFYDTANGVCK
jgi:outer membrane usher protein FimD/PapC